MRDYVEQVELIRSFACNQYPQCEDCEMVLNGHECRSAIERQAADAIEELLSAVPKWISVEDRLPEPYQNVLTCAQKLFGVDRRLVYGIDYTLDNGEWACGGESYKTMVTHWMPLPKPPKEVE